MKVIDAAPEMTQRSVMQMTGSFSSENIERSERISGTAASTLTNVQPSQINNNYRTVFANNNISIFTKKYRINTILSIAVNSMIGLRVVCESVRRLLQQSDAAVANSCVCIRRIKPCPH